MPFLSFFNKFQFTTDWHEWWHDDFINKTFVVVWKMWEIWESKVAWLVIISFFRQVRWNLLQLFIFGLVLFVLSIDECLWAPNSYFSVIVFVFKETRMIWLFILMFSLYLLINFRDHFADFLPRNIRFIVLNRFQRYLSISFMKKHHLSSDFSYWSM